MRLARNKVFIVFLTPANAFTRVSPPLCPVGCYYVVSDGRLIFKRDNLPTFSVKSQKSNDL